MLKAIGFKYIITLEDRKAFVKDTFHNLSEILKAISPYIELSVKQDQEAYDWICAYFQDINDIDKESDSFRYPFRIKYEKLFDEYSVDCLFKKQTHIDLVKFANKLEVAFELLVTLYYDNFGNNKNYQKYRPILLEEGGSYYGQSVVGYKFSVAEYYLYVKAYTESASYLYDLIVQDNSLKDLLFIPMCYLYRNGVELALKEILFEESKFSRQEALKIMYKKKHKLCGIWNYIKNEIQQHADAPTGDTTIENAEKYLIQLNDIDGAADKFRYPTDKFLNYHYKKKKKYDIENVSNFFSQLISFLSGVNSMMSIHNEWKAEMEAEYHSEMEAYYGDWQYDY